MAELKYSKAIADGVSDLSVLLQGQLLQGRVTDSDAIDLLSLLFLEPHERSILMKQDATQAQKIIAQRQREARDAKLQPALDGLGEQREIDRITKEVDDDLEKQYATVMYHRCNSDRSVRSDLAQRIVEIFPSVDRAIISQEYFKDGVCQPARIRLSAAELMEFMAIMISVGVGLMQKTMPLEGEQVSAEEKPKTLKEELAAVQPQQEVAKGFEVRTDEAIATPVEEAKDGRLSQEEVEAAIANLPEELRMRLRSGEV